MYKTRLLIGEFLIILGKLACYVPDHRLRNKIADQLERWFNSLNLE